MQQTTSLKSTKVLVTPARVCFTYEPGQEHSIPIRVQVSSPRNFSYVIYDSFFRSVRGIYSAVSMS
jgi:hypothetical protein